MVILLITMVVTNDSYDADLDNAYMNDSCNVYNDDYDDDYDDDYGDDCDLVDDVDGYDEEFNDHYDNDNDE